MKKTKYILLGILVLIFTFTSVIVAEDDVEYEDGRYAGYVPDDHGDAVVEVEIEHGAIADVNIVNPFKLHYDYEEAHEFWLEYPHMVMENQNTEDIDAVSGATGSHERLTEATDQALDIAAGEYDDNKYYGVAKDYENGHVVVEITVEDDEITEFDFITANPDLLEEDDSREMLMEAKDEDYPLEEAYEYFDDFPDKVVENQGNVDLVSGVTGSYETFNAALDMAMEQADLK